MNRRRGPVPAFAGRADTDQPEQAHQPGDAFAADPNAAAEPQLEPDPRRAIGRPRRGVDVADLVGEVCVFDVASRRPATSPLVIARAGDVQNPAGHRDVQAVSGELLDQPEPYFVPL